MRKVTTLFFVFALLVMAVFPAGAAAQELKGTIKIDGSSTVYPITQAMAEEFSYEYPRVRVTVGVSGTGGGFAKFNVGETDLSDASREIKKSEAEIAAENGIEFTKFIVGYDGITVAVNPENNWANDMTVEELKMVWEPNSSVETWSDIRDEWPDEEIDLYGPGADSGTFDYFTEVINGKSGASRSDFTASEDDNVLVRGISGNKYALGYFGYAYYEENSDSLKAVAVNGVLPNRETIASNKYTPLARPLFVYAKNSAVQRPEVEAFLKFYFENAPEIVPQTGYAPLPSYEEALAKVEKLAK
ncbi:MAG: phosphate transport system substrate-binding protein [Halanaerobium sp. 4-GBenrich]|jgi:phosphate transport system substrate-binding protein|uniref:Phosphate-binding protein n=1 Tax=Halanaerobium congolense TaxID=54121 RepID=A0A1G6LM90_9FIRM|nr:PstS family phosphate ABC transporter substrate-binding protein [Halanaerobium congolense]KXS49730.1 MAG: phosphate transport system substrate-binding protein [Halanaerobium sp. T82-1]ODS50316.1 MAG: phosphate transport system substrate-binding protein [Halanaerobium sp. 4-GBenrich]OEG63323.1 MAG: phosphate ABC transporter substrate-binding protein [Halanaerobium sp. MDAL1]PTX15655.1 phosphate ABC transporter substrate-binding protein (PhoT family) [Halanaerobium congolense]TDX42452.1 phosp